MNQEQQLEAKLQQYRNELREAKNRVRELETSVNVLTVYKTMRTVGLKMGDRFQLMGTFLKQTNPFAIAAHHRDGKLVSLVYRVDGSLSRNEFILYQHRLGSVVPLGKDPVNGDKYAKNFDVSELLAEPDEVSK